MTRITNNMMVNTLRRNLFSSMEQLDKLQRQLASGRKINRPSDDPSALVKSLRLRTNLVEGDQYLANIGEAVSFLETTDGACKNINELMHRLRELTVKGATGTNDPSAHQAIAKEIKELYAQLGMIANTDYGGKFIFGGTNVTERPYQNGVWVGNENKLEAEIGIGVEVPINLVGMKDFFMGRLNDLNIDSASGLLGLSTNSLREGRYEVQTEVAGVASPAQLSLPQKYLQQVGTKSILGGYQDPPGLTLTAGDNLNASMELTVERVDPLRHTVTYSYRTHEYDSATGAHNVVPPPGQPSPKFELEYQFIDSSGTFVNLPAAATPQTVTIGNVQFQVNLAVDVSNLDGADFTGLDPATATADQVIDRAMTFESTGAILSELTAGDKGIIDLTAQSAAVDHRVTISFEDNMGQTLEQTFSFAPGVLDNNTTELTFLNMNDRTGLNYDGSMTFSFGTFASADPAVSFDYQAGILAYTADLARKVEAGKLPDVGNELGGIDLRLQELLQHRATIGAKVNRLELQENRLISTQENLTGLLSQNEDANEAEVIMELKMQENVYRAALAAGARIVMPSLVDFLR